MFDGIYRNQSLIILDFMILDFKFQPHKSDSQLETCNSPKVNSMRREWITKEGSRILTLFFCGWGMDERAVQHVKGKGDLLLFMITGIFPGRKHRRSRGTRVCVSWLGRWGCGRHRCC